MLITYLKRLKPELSNNNIKDLELNNNFEISNLVEFYKAAKKEFDNNIDFQQQSRFEVVQLQSGNIHSLKLWETICNISRIEFQNLYNL
jgi:arginyl-tRNA synthetase